METYIETHTPISFIFHNILGELEVVTRYPGQVIAPAEGFSQKNQERKKSKNLKTSIKIQKNI